MTLSPSNTSDINTNLNRIPQKSNQQYVCHFTTRLTNHQTNPRRHDNMTTSCSFTHAAQLWNMFLAHGGHETYHAPRRFAAAQDTQKRPRAHQRHVKTHRNYAPQQVKTGTHPHNALTQDTRLRCPNMWLTLSVDVASESSMDMVSAKKQAETKHSDNEKATMCC